MQMGPFDLVELQCPGDRVEHGLRRMGRAPLLQAYVVVDADPGELCHLLAAQARHPATAVRRQVDRVRVESIATGRQPLAELCGFVHTAQYGQLARSQGGSVNPRKERLWLALDQRVSVGSNDSNVWRQP